MIVNRWFNLILWGRSLDIGEHLYHPINKFTWTATGFIIFKNSWHLRSQICSAVRCQTVSRTHRNKSNQIKSNQIKSNQTHKAPQTSASVFDVPLIKCSDRRNNKKYVCPHSFVLGGHEGLRQRGGGGNFFRVRHMTSEGSDEERAQIWMFS